MKKFVMLTMAVALIAFFAMPKGASAAAPQMIFKGDYQVVGIMSDNVYDRNDDSSDNAAYVEQRFRLTNIAAMENVKGVFGIEVGWDEWGKSYTANGIGTTTYPAGDPGDTGISGDTKATNIEVRFAYIEFNVPGMPLSVTAGKQALFTHNHAILTGAAECPGLKFNYKIADGANLSLWWAKLAEGTVSSATLRGNGDADSDMYTLEYSQKTQAYDLGIYGVWNRDHRESNVASPPVAVTTQLYNDDIYWAGVWAGFMAGPAKLGVDAIYSFGKRDRSYTGQTDLDYSGYYLKVNGSVNLGGPTLDFMSVYASGDNDNTDNKLNHFAYADAPARYPGLGLLTPGPNLLYWGNGIAPEEYAQICIPTAGYSAYDSGSVLGRWFTMLGATVPVDNKLKLVAKYWYLQTAEKFPTASNYRNKNIGHEVDLEAHYQMTPNLTTSVEGDYLFAGDYFKTLSTMEPDNAWKVAWAIKLVF